MDPVSIAALIGLGGKVIDAGVELVKSWRVNGGGGVALGIDGSRFDLARDGWNGQPTLVEPARLGFGRPVAFEGIFVAADQWAQDYLDADQPVLVVIEDLDQESGLDSVVALVRLGSPFEGHLFPGSYQFGAFVFLDEDFIEWDDLDGGAFVEFGVVAGEPPFRLEIPIEVTAHPYFLYASGDLRPGERDHYEVVFDAGLTYSIYVAPAHPGADLDLYVYDENGLVVDVDDDPDSDAECIVTPRWTGPFTVVVECHGGRSTYEIHVQPTLG